VKAENT